MDNEITIDSCGRLHKKGVHGALKQFTAEELILRGRVDCKRARENRKKKDPVGFEKAMREAWLKQQYGITLEDYDRMLKQQNGVCYVCKEPETRICRGKIRRLSVDHNHETGKVRKLLCNDCNFDVGIMEDDVRRVRAENYLKEHKQC